MVGGDIVVKVIRVSSWQDAGCPEERFFLIPWDQTCAASATLTFTDEGIVIGSLTGGVSGNCASLYGTYGDCDIAVCVYV